MAEPENSKSRSADQDRALYRTVFENTGTATVLIEEDMTISLVNTELTRISGIDKPLVEMKMKFPELIAEQDRDTVIANHYLRRSDPDKAPRNYPCRVKVAGAKIKECLLTVALVEGTKQSVASITDLSKQKDLERQVARISQEERLHVGQLLHDDLGSHLAGVEAMSAILAARLTRSGHQEAGLAEEIKELVNQAIIKTKSLVQGLVPVDVAQTGFMQAIDQYRLGVEKAFSVECAVSGEISASSLEPERLSHLYYIVREAVNNAARHGEATRIDIFFEQSNAFIKARIFDDGKGFDPNDSHFKGVGHQIMKLRADLIGADLEIRPDSDKGTTVQCRIKRIYAS